jgi:hypothetical protein
MPLTANTFTVGTAVTTISEMSVDAQISHVQNLEPNMTAEDLTRAGYVYLLSQKFDILGAGTAIFNIATGADGLQIEFYEIVTTVSPIYAELIEGATPTVTGSAIAAYNLNREASDAHSVEFKAVTSYTGGTTVSAELLTGSNQAGSSMQLNKIHTLQGDSDYVMKFTNIGNQTTTVFLQMAFAEKYNGMTEVWLGNEVGDGYCLKGGEKIKAELISGQSLTAISSGSVQVGVLRQD